MRTTTQIILGLFSILLVLVGDKLAIPFLGNAGIACLRLTSMAIGWEAIITRHIVIGRRRHGNVQTYTDLPAILQGIQFNLLGWKYYMEVNSGHEFTRVISCCEFVK